jgi:hypothetical protein
MNNNKEINGLSSKLQLQGLVNLFGKEVNMSTKSVLRIVLAAGLVVLILLSVQVLRSESAPSTTSNDRPANYYVGSDWIERHPSVDLTANYYVGSDWIERHPVSIRLANYYTGSDWIERHPSPTQPANYYTGSDWIERHPSQPTP